MGPEGKDVHSICPGLDFFYTAKEESHLSARRSSFCLALGGDCLLSLKEEATDGESGCPVGQSICPHILVIPSPTKLGHSSQGPEHNSSVFQSAKII